jgi:leader peptidase (prepilin peptidase)/N-methyltransferase
MSSIDLVFSVALVATLVAIALVDFRDMIIPDWLNLSLAGLGLTHRVVTQGTFPATAIVFAALVFLGFWLARLGYRRLRGVAGLGLGDVKMAGGSALWFSPWNLPLFLFAASVSALIYVIVLRMVKGPRAYEARIPFGPFIGVGLLVTWAMERSMLPTFIPDRGY